MLTWLLLPLLLLASCLCTVPCRCELPFVTDDSNMQATYLHLACTAEEAAQTCSHNGTSSHGNSRYTQFVLVLMP
jgi:hypothetical protein